MSWDTITGWITDNQATIIATSLKIVGVVVGAILVTRFMRKAVQRVEKRVSEDTTPIRALQRSQTLAKVLSSAGIVIIWSISIFLVLSELGFKLGPLLAGVGIIGLAVGFGSQNLVRDVVSGFFILFEDQYGVGDVVQINEVATGKVEQLTLRITGLRDLDGTMHYIANGEIVHVANRTKDWARAVIDVGVGYGEAPAKVRAVLERIAEDAKADEELGRNIFATPDVLGVENLGEYEVIWRMLAETKPARQWEVSRALRERVKVAFDNNGVEIPFPHTVMISAEGR